MADNTDILTIDYMIRRALTLLLGDLRPSKRESYTTSFGVHASLSSGTTEGPILAELFLVFNLWRCAKKLSQILDLFSMPKGWFRQTKLVDPRDIDGPIDWPKTFEHRQLGGEGYVIQSFGRKVAIAQAEYVVFILREFDLHCRLLKIKLFETLGNNIPQYLLAALHDINKIREKTRKTIKEQFNEVKVSSVGNLDEVEEILSEIFLKLSSINNSYFAEYEKKIKLRKQQGTFIFSSVERLKVWREEYLGCYSEFGNENFFEYKRNNSAADLYEIWCFYEMCAAVKRCGLTNIAQLCTLKRRQNIPQFQIGEHSYAYFDYHTSSLVHAWSNSGVNPSIIRSAMPGVFVEWFIRNLTKYEDSICIDTKFANWDSRELLKTAGYMMNFGIRNGVLIIRDRIRESTLAGVSILPDLHKVTFPHPHDATLWVVSLNPGKEREEHNTHTLNKLALELFAS